MRLILLAVFLISACGGSPKKTGAGTAGGNPLFIFYINGDNTLVSDESKPLAPQILREIKAELQKHPRWEAWIFYDPPSNLEPVSTLEVWRDGKFYRVKTFRGVDPVALAPFKDMAQAMGKLSGDKGFKEAHFIYWGHGFSWRGSRQISLRHYKTELSTPRFADLLNDFLEELSAGGVLARAHLTSLTFDACMMATLENIFELHPLAFNLVVAPVLVPEKGIVYSTLPVLSESPERFAAANSNLKSRSVVGRKFLVITEPRVDPSLKKAFQSWMGFFDKEPGRALASFRQMQAQMSDQGAQFVGVSISDFISFSGKALQGAGQLPVSAGFLSEVKLDIPPRIEVMTDPDVAKKAGRLKLAEELPLQEFYEALAR